MPYVKRDNKTMVPNARFWFILLMVEFLTKTLGQTMNDVLAMANGGQALCDMNAAGGNSPYGLLLFKPEGPSVFSQGNDGVERAIREATIQCAAEEGWHLYEGFMVQRPTENSVQLGMNFHDPRSGEGNLQAMKKFLQAKVLNHQDINGKVSLKPEYDVTGRLVRYGFKVNPGEDQFAIMDRIAARIEKKINEANSEHLCPLVRAVCNYRSFQSTVDREMQSTMRFGSI